MGLFEGQRRGFVILNVIFGINFLLQNTSLQSGAGVCLWSRVFTKHCKGLRSLSLSLHYRPGASSMRKMSIDPRAEHLKVSTIKGAEPGSYGVSCTSLQLLNCKVALHDSRTHVKPVLENENS